MAADEMAEHCGLQTWMTNGRCVMATAGEDDVGAAPCAAPDADPAA
jgi:hypothetical protein